jgi:hypothetical protein
MWTLQFTAPARHWIEAIKINIFIRGKTSYTIIDLLIRKKESNRRVELKFHARFLLSNFVDITYGTKIRTIHIGQTFIKHINVFRLDGMIDEFNEFLGFRLLGSCRISTSSIELLDY